MGEFLDFRQGGFFQGPFQIFPDHQEGLFFGREVEISRLQGSGKIEKIHILAKQDPVQPFLGHKLLQAAEAALYFKRGHE
jgi:hypothetical protein